ncbi:adhesion G protein-coupled receptor E3-like [Haliotis asinina]|uniref:adhesion G protein-coupled receptor E3-like n=1 Tax=Haliotis asinina TaxID=109174 RepID=UPI0035322374
MCQPSQRAECRTAVRFPSVLVKLTNDQRCRSYLEHDEDEVGPVLLFRGGRVMLLEGKFVPERFESFAGASPFSWVLWVLLACFHATKSGPTPSVQVPPIGDRDNTTFLDPVDSAELKAIHSDQVLEEDSFFILEEKVYACNTFNHSRPKSNILIFFKYDHIQGILTYVTSGVSMVSLLTTVVVYSLLPELRNLPGRLTMSLSATLLLAQTLLLLIHLPTGWLCQALAITLHFSWLCSFMWMTVMSMSLAHTFQSKTKQALSRRADTTYALFSLLAFGIPAVIVGVSVFIDLLNVPGFDIGYGASEVCWIANSSASLLVFGLPVGLSVAANTISFVITYYNIEKSLKLSKNVSSTGNDKSRFVIYMVQATCILMEIILSFGDQMSYLFDSNVFSGCELTVYCISCHLHA